MFLKTEFGRLPFPLQLHKSGTKYLLPLKLHQQWTVSIITLKPTISPFHEMSTHAIDCPHLRYKSILSGGALTNLLHFYRAMHFSVKRGIAIACRLSVRLSVRPSLCPSETLVNCDHIGWNSSKIISPLVSLGCSLFATPNMTGLLQGEHP